MSIEARLAALDLPLPLKREVDRLLGLMNLDKRQEELLQAAEMTCRISALAALAVCRHSGFRSDALDRACARLDRPSFGIWVELLRKAAALLRENNDDLLRSLTEGLATRITKASPLEALSRLLHGDPGKSGGSVLDVIDALPNYRNRVRGHGVAIDAAARERDAGPLLDGLLALWEAVPPSGGLHVVRVVRIEQTAEGAFADLLVMHGSAPTVMRERVGPEHATMVGTVQLFREPSTWVRLAPLAAAEEAAGTWQLGWLAGTVLAPTFSYQTDSRAFQASATQDDYESVLGLKGVIEVDAELQERLRLDPYRGLLAYEEMDYPVFFGREEETERAVSRLTEKGSLVIVGASGSGKSSLMRAGVLPALKKKGGGEAREVSSIVLIPGRRPFDALRAALRNAGPDQPSEAATWSRLIAEMLPDAEHVKPDGVLHLLVGLAGKNRKVCLCVDQLEELVTNDVAPAERKAFLDVIVGAARSDALIVATVRSDLIGPLLEHEGFRNLHDDCVMSIGGLSTAQLHRIIREPLKGRHVTIDDDLPATIVREVEGRPGALALLSQVLTTLWEERAAFGNRLTKSGYETAGGVHGCVAAQAGKARDEVPPERRPMLDALLLQLVSRGDHDTFVRRRALLDDAAQVLETSVAEVRAILGPFVARRLIVLATEAADGSSQSGGHTAEVAHEALIVGWPHLRDLVATQAEVIDLRSRVEEGCDAWEAASRRREFWNDDNSNLRRAEELVAAGRLPLPARQREFLVASRSRVRRRRMVERLVLAGLGVLLVVAAIAFVLANRARREADAATIAANLATKEAKDSGALAESRAVELAVQERLKRAEAFSLIAQREVKFSPRLALANGIASLRMDPDLAADTWAACLTAVRDGGKCLWVSPNAATAAGKIVSIAYTRDGTKVLFATDAGEIDVRSASTGESLSRVLISTNTTCAAFSPDGDTVASGSDDGVVWLWDVATGGDRGQLEGHSGLVTSVAFSPDGTHLVSGSFDRTVRLWDLPKRSQVWRIDAHQDRVMGVAFSADGATVASCSWDKTACLWDAASGTLVRRLAENAGPIVCVAFDRNGRHVAAGSADKTVRIWNLPGGASRTFAGHSEPVWTLAFSGDGTTLATGSGDKTVRMWDVATGRESGTLEGHTWVVRCLAWSPDGRRLSSGGNDRVVRTWDLASGAEVQPLDGHTGVATAVAFNREGSQIVSGSSDATVRLWNVATGQQQRRLVGHLGEVSGVAFSPDGAKVVSGSVDRSVRIWDAKTGAQERSLMGHDGPVRSVDFSPDGLKVASCGDDGTIRLWDSASGAPLRTFEVPVISWEPSPTESRPETVPRTVVYSVRFDPSGARLVSGGSDRIARVWDVVTGSQIRTYVLDEAVEAVTFDGSGRNVLASGGRGSSAIIFDQARGEAAGSLSGHSALITSVAASPRGSLLATGSVDRTVRVWDLDGDFRLEGHGAGVEAVAFSRDGTKLASASADHTVRLWDLSGGAEVRKLGNKHPFSTAGAFSPDGTLLATAGADRLVTVWSVATGNKRWDFDGHSEDVGVLAFSHDNAIVAAGSLDKSVRLWDVVTGERLRSLMGHTEAITALAFNGDGTRIATGAWDFTARVWEVESGRELRRFEGHTSDITGIVFLDADTVGVRLLDGTIRLWDSRTGSPSAKDGATGELGRKIRARFPPQRGDLRRVLRVETDWLTAWWDQQAFAGAGPSPRLTSVLDRWERSIGMRINLANNRIEVISQPGSAYAGTRHAEHCR